MNYSDGFSHVGDGGAAFAAARSHAGTGCIQGRPSWQSALRKPYDEIVDYSFASTLFSLHNGVRQPIDYTAITKTGQARIPRKHRFLWPPAACAWLLAVFTEWPERNSGAFFAECVCSVCLLPESFREKGKNNYRQLSGFILDISLLLQTVNTKLAYAGTPDLALLSAFQWSSCKLVLCNQSQNETIVGPWSINETP